MKPAIFDELRRIVYAQSGIRLREGKQLMVASRLAARLRELELEDEAAYLAYLRGHMDEEIVPLLDAISTNVTHFFREAEHFEILRQELVERLARGQGRLRLWCAASSTGEEPYSLAITVREALAASGRACDVRILATDISTRVLAVARRGEYEPEKLESLPKATLARYFEAFAGPEGRMYRARPELASLLVFKRLNLAEPPFPMKGPLDAIFCRNVMIYFDDAVRDPLVAECHRLLRPDGLFVVGKSESLTRVGALFQRSGPSVYRPIPRANGARVA